MIAYFMLACLHIECRIPCSSKEVEPIRFLRLGISKRCVNKGRMWDPINKFISPYSLRPAILRQ